MAQKPDPGSKGFLFVLFLVIEDPSWGSVCGHDHTPLGLLVARLGPKPLPSPCKFPPVATWRHCICLIADRLLVLAGEAYAFGSLFPMLPKQGSWPAVKAESDW